MALSTALAKALNFTWDEIMDIIASGRRPRAVYAQLDALAEQAGSDHADRIVDVLAQVPGEAAQRILDFGALSLEAAVEKFAAILREFAPESEVEKLVALVRAAYDARLAFPLWPGGGAGMRGL